MEQKKVLLPRKVAEALENIKVQKGHLDCYILWRASRPESKEDQIASWNVLYEFVTEVGNNIFLLADALRYGYYISEPITVEITTEQQEKIRRYYESISKDDEESEEFKRGEQLGFCEAYDLAGIKIDGVNA